MAAPGAECRATLDAPTRTHHVKLNDPDWARDDDRVLAAAFIERRDERAFRALYARHSPALYGLLCRLVGAADAQDVVQETWLRAARGLPGFRWEGALRTWLTGIALNCARELRRAQNPRSPIVPESAPRPTSIGQRIDLERAVQGIAEGYRAVLLLHDAQGYTHAEIAALLGVEEGTSKSQLSRARRAVRELLKGGPEPRGKSDGG
jgi:RNA polymerase sigma-70 factor (ECF subfamily)